MKKPSSHVSGASSSQALDHRIDSNRRRLILAGASAFSSVGAAGCSVAEAGASYDSAVQSTWELASHSTSSRKGALNELVRCATLAPSSHNTQCWKFQIGEDAITVLPDLSRRCPAVDPDDHHLYVSLGCAVENLSHAALVYGWNANARLVEVPGDVANRVVRIQLDRTAAVSTKLFNAIFARQSTRTEFDGRPVSTEDLRLLEQAGTGDGIEVLIYTDERAREKVLDHVINANTIQMRDASFVRELKSWIRFSEDEAVLTGDGLFSGASGGPVVPRWLGSPLFSAFFRLDSENDKYARWLRSSSAVAIFVSEKSDQTHWFEAGRCYERFALQAAALGIRNSLVNQPVEVESTRRAFGKDMGVGDRRIDMVVRFGFGPRMPRSLRRPVNLVVT